MKTEKRANPVVEIRRILLTVVCGVFMPILLSTTYVFVTFGSFKNAISFSKGLRLVVEPATLRLDEGRLGDTKTGKIIVQNLSFASLSVLGVESNCSCTSTDKMPIELKPRQTKELNVQMHLESLGEIEQQLTFYTTSPSLPRFTIKVRVEVRP